MSFASKRHSRRQFLAGAAAVTAPLIIPRSVLGDATTPGANDHVGIGRIAVGRRGGQLAILSSMKVVATADCNLPRAEAMAAKHGAKAYQDYRELLERKDIDAVLVASPDHWHTLHSVHACMAEKDVYVEKPMTLTIREGRQLVNAARKYKRVVTCGSQQRSMAMNRIGCELVRSGKIGKVTTVIGRNYPSPWHCALPGQEVPTGLDWDAWCGQVEPVPYHKDIYTPRAAPGWISFRRFSGGEMTGWGAHGLDQVQWALGMDETGPTEVWVEGPKFDPPTFTEPGSRGQGEGVCGKPTIFYRYANGTVLKLENGPSGGALFEGEEGTVAVDRGRARVMKGEGATEAFNELVKAGTRDPDHMTNFIECIKTRETPNADVEWGHRSSTVCHLGNIARWLNRKLKWDPEAEQFIGDDEANGLVAREQRKPYQIPDV